MQKIPYFGRQLDPAQLRKNNGLRGWAIWALNLLRSALEDWLIFAVLDVNLKNEGWPKGERKRLVAEAKKDPFFSPNKWHEVATRKPRFVLRDKLEQMHAEKPARAERYAGGRKNSDERGPERPIPFAEGMQVTFSEEAQKSDRSARYVSGRGTRLLSDEDQYTAVPPSRVSRRKGKTNE